MPRHRNHPSRSPSRSPSPSPSPLLPLLLSLSLLLLPATALAGLSVVPSTTKVLKPWKGAGATSASIEAARNEWEAFQVIVAADGTPITGVSAELSDLAGPGGAVIPASAANLYLEYYVHIDAPSYCEYALNWYCDQYPEYLRNPGDYPDALVPFFDPYGDAHAPVAVPFDVAANDFQTVFVEVLVPLDAVPGDYAGTLTVRAGESVVGAVPVALHVWDFAVPVERTIATSYGFWDGTPNWHAGMDDPATAERIRRNYEWAAHEHRVDYTGHDVGLSFEFAEDGTLSKTDTAAFDAAMKPRVDGSFYPDGAGIRRFDFPGFSPGSGTHGMTEAQYAQAAKAAIEHLDAVGMRDNAYLYSSDEPWMIGHEAAIPAIKADVERLRTASDLWNGLVMVTGPWLQSLDGYIDIWCPVTPMYGNTAWPEGAWPGPDKYAAELTAGRSLWFYVCNANFPPALGYDVDSPTGYEPRILKWQAWHENSTGFLFWTMTYWQSPDPWNDLANVEGFGPLFARNGDGILIYPGNHDGNQAPGGSPAHVAIDGPVVSFRLKQIRDGLEDWEILRMADGLGGGAYVRGQVERAVVRFGDSLDDYFDASDRPWTLDEAVVLDARRNISRKVQHLLAPDTYEDPEPPAQPDPGPEAAEAVDAAEDAATEAGGDEAAAEEVTATDDPGGTQEVVEDSGAVADAFVAADPGSAGKGGSSGCAAAGAGTAGGAGAALAILAWVAFAAVLRRPKRHGEVPGATFR